MRISERIWPADEKSTGWILLCYYLGSVILFELDEYKIQLDKNEKNSVGNIIMNENLLLKYNSNMKGRRWDFKNGCCIFRSNESQFDGRTIRSIINFVNSLHEAYPQINMPISFEFGQVSFQDKLTYIIFEVICFVLIKEYHHNVYVKFKSKPSIFTEGIDSSPLLLLTTGEKEHREKFVKKYAFDIYKNHYRRILLKHEVEDEKLSIIMEEISIFLKMFYVSDEFIDEISEVAIELIGNVSEHTGSSCLVDIDVTPMDYIKRTDENNRFYGINLSVVNFSEHLFNEDIKERILSNRDKMSGRYKDVWNAYKFHQGYFNSEYTEDDFFNIAAFQHKISGSIRKEVTGGTGLTKLIYSLEKRSDAHNCYMSSGRRLLWFQREFLEYNDDNWIGFNLNKDFLTHIPERKVVDLGTVYMPGTAYNLNFAMKGREKENE